MCAAAALDKIARDLAYRPEQEEAQPCCNGWPAWTPRNGTCHVSTVESKLIASLIYMCNFRFMSW